MLNRIYKLKNLVIDCISVVEDDSTPKNPDAKFLLIKSKKEEKNVEKSKVVAFLHKLIGHVEKETDKPTPDAVVAKGTTEAKKETPEYITKVEFQESMATLQKGITEVIKGSVQEKVEVEKAERTEVYKGLLDAFQSDMDEFKKSVIKEKRSEPPVTKQPEIEDLFNHAVQKQQKANTSPALLGTAVTDFVQSKVEDGSLPKHMFPRSETDYSKAIKLLCDMGEGV